MEGWCAIYSRPFLPLGLYSFLTELGMKPHPIHESPSSPRKLTDESISGLAYAARVHDYTTSTRGEDK